MMKSQVQHIPLMQEIKIAFAPLWVAKRIYEIVGALDGKTVANCNPHKPLYGEAKGWRNGKLIHMAWGEAKCAINATQSYVDAMMFMIRGDEVNPEQKCVIPLVHIADKYQAEKFAENVGNRLLDMFCHGNDGEKHPEGTYLDNSEIKTESIFKQADRLKDNG